MTWFFLKTKIQVLLQLKLWNNWVPYNEIAIEFVVEGLKTFRPNLTREQIIRIIDDYRKKGHKARVLAETYQDVYWGYIRALESLGFKYE